MLGFDNIYYKFLGEMVITMTPHILRFCKSLPLFTGPKLLLDVNLVQWTDRYLPVKKSKKKAKVVTKVPREKAVVENVQEAKAETKEAERQVAEQEGEDVEKDGGEAVERVEEAEQQHEEVAKLEEEEQVDDTELDDLETEHEDSD